MRKGPGALGSDSAPVRTVKAASCETLGQSIEILPDQVRLLDGIAEVRAKKI